MRSLSPHLRQPDDHGRLPFHRHCPICREQRLTGTLATEPVVSYRARAALAASVLALSTAAPSAAVAAEGDSQQDGTAPPTQTGSGDPADSPNFDPGGDSTDLPFDAPPSPQVQAPPDPGNDDTAPLDQDPSTDPGAPTADPGDGSTPPAGQQPAEAPPAATAPPAVGSPEQTNSTPAPAPAPTPAPVAPSPSAPPAVPRVVHSRPQLVRGRDKRLKESGDARPAAGGTVAGSSPAGAASTSSPPVAQPQPVASTRLVIVGRRARPGDRSHRVLTGESLWSIASDRLGGTASPARVAREVHRLWTMNKGRIGTGDPDLLMVGTRLRLR
jgi:hypothetical protein